MLTAEKGKTPDKVEFKAFRDCREEVEEKMDSRKSEAKSKTGHGATG